MNGQTLSGECVGLLACPARCGIPFRDERRRGRTCAGTSIRPGDGSAAPRARYLPLSRSLATAAGKDVGVRTVHTSRRVRRVRTRLSVPHQRPDRRSHSLEYRPAPGPRTDQCSWHGNHTGRDAFRSATDRLGHESEETNGTIAITHAERVTAPPSAAIAERTARGACISRTSIARPLAASFLSVFDIVISPRPQNRTW
jgi:hypothetical protein